MYIELNVQTAGYLKDGKIEINGKNFYLQTALPKDSVLKNNYIGNNVKTLDLNTIDNMELLLSYKSNVKELNEFHK